MNVRFSDQTIRLRITKAELMLLLAGEVVETKTILGTQGRFLCQLRALHQEAPAVFKHIESAFYLELNRPLLLDLAKGAPSKEGLTFFLEPESPHPFKIVIEVDIFLRGPRNS